MASILVFDSGVGGLSVAKHIHKKLPHININYLADNLKAPYGQLSEQAMTERCVSLISEAQQRLTIDLVVIACNSASTRVLDAARTVTELPVVGVVPAIKPAAQISDNKQIILLATNATINSSYTDKLIEDFAADCQITKIAAPTLVSLVEKQLRGKTLNQSDYQAIFTPYATQNSFQQADTIVLACTHFPWAKKPLIECLPQVKHWVDSGDAIARRVADLLGKTPSKSEGITEQDPVMYATDLEKFIASGFEDFLRSRGVKQFSEW